MGAAVAVFGLLLGIGGTAMSAVGQSQQARHQARMARANAEISKRNAEIAQQKATDAEARGATAEDTLRARVMKISGAQRARFAASGIALDSPLVESAAETLFFESELDAAVIRQNTAQEARGLRQQGDIFNMQAAAGQAQAGFFQQAGQSAFTETILTGAGQVASQWYALSQEAGGSGDTQLFESTDTSFGIT